MVKERGVNCALAVLIAQHRTTMDNALPSTEARTALLLRTE